MTRLLNLYLDKTVLAIPGSRLHWWSQSPKGTGQLTRGQSDNGRSGFMGTQELPCHQHGRTQLSALNDENVTHKIKEALIERAKWFPLWRWMSWRWSQAQKFKISSQKLESIAIDLEEHGMPLVGQGWDGGMADTRMACIQMAMSGRM
jgi:hypothetical protein